LESSTISSKNEETTMTDLSEIRERHSRATPGPYKYDQCKTENGVRYQHIFVGPFQDKKEWNVNVSAGTGITDTFHHEKIMKETPGGDVLVQEARHGSEEDANFLAHSWGDIKLMLEEIDWLTAVNRKLLGVLIGDERFEHLSKKPGEQNDQAD